MNLHRSASASLRPCRYAAPLRGRPTRSGGGAALGTPGNNPNNPGLDSNLQPLQTFNQATGNSSEF